MMQTPFMTFEAFEAFHAVTFSAAIPKPSHSETCTGSLSNLLG